MPRLLSLVACLYSIGSFEVLTAESWDRFRGPNGSGVSEDKGYPTEFSRDKNVVWRSPVRPGKSSPVLTSRHVFLTGFDGGKLYTQCFERKTGKLLWERFIEPAGIELANRLNHPAALTPVTDGENVYAFFKDYGLVSYNSEGKLRWKTPLGPFATTQGLGSSPVLAGDLLVLVLDQWENSYIAGFSRSNGEVRWKVPRTEAEGWSTPLVHGGGAGSHIVTASRGQFGMHRVADGSRIATLKGLAASIVASPVLDGDTVYAFGYGADEPLPFAPRLQRLDKNKDGKLSPDEYGNDSILNNLGRNAGNRDGVVSEEDWQLFANGALGPNCLMAIRIENGRPRELWRHDKNFTSVVPSVLAYQSVLYIVRNGGILASHDAATGTPVKTARIEGALGGYSSSPVAADGRIWIASEEGRVSVIRAGAQWELLAVNDLGEGCYATPALSGGVIYLRTDDGLYAFASQQASN
ncbi:MAG TPA: PQQ-binding-like beta-propeller repeat protein [Bryobacteraceae bacterium]|nr:PQQ-binding-like beta-propeller repeat protein [Bryobacteraceae bacterium]